MEKCNSCLHWSDKWFCCSLGRADGYGCPSYHNLDVCPFCYGLNKNCRYCQILKEEEEGKINESIDTRR